METKPNPDEGNTGETQSEAETQYDEALRSPEARARSKPGPRQVGDFRLGRLLGRGGMGAVYVAYEQSMRRTVALKILDSGIDPSANEVSRFEREAWIAGRLNHPNIVKALSQGEESGTRYMAMELIDGCSLAGEIRSTKDDASRQPSDAKWQSARIRKMVTLFVSVANALQHVHENGIIHRDIKPQNLLLTKDESRLFLTDFGLARDEQASQLTRRGDFLGTIRYMSPEQLLAQRAQVDRRTDIWSLGVSLYEAVTLDVPYSGASEEAYITAISMRQPLPASARNPSVPRDLETVLMKCLERDPERRYSSAAELSADLQRFVRDAGSSPAPRADGEAQEGRQTASHGHYGRHRFGGTRAVPAGSAGSLAKIAGRGWTDSLGSATNDIQQCRSREAGSGLGTLRAEAGIPIEAESGRRFGPTGESGGNSTGFSLALLRTHLE